MRDIEGKVAREAMSECGQRASFNTFRVAAREGGTNHDSEAKSLDRPPFSPLDRV
jgi:hypothetical protein